MIRPAKIWILAIALTVVSTISARADCPIGDLSGDCQVGLEDLGLFVGKWLDDSDNSADLNGDGKVDMADFAIISETWNKGGWKVVINEIHYNPDIETELVEFVELYNAGVVDANISGWYF
ncbi:MAG: hypothetical protein MUP16_01650, partial [Sedimentisphaerales bacterium]|nr:hypothetical protein [Sedimentisphaerales bacterium]